MLFEWKSHPVKEIQLNSLASDFIIPPVINKILSKRKIDSEVKFKKFIKPQLTD